MGRHRRTRKRIGSRAQVYHDNADETSGGLTKKDLVKNKHGSIVSRKKQALARKQKHLEKAGYKPTKGKFVLMRKGSRSSRRARKTKRRRR